MDGVMPTGRVTRAAFRVWADEQPGRYELIGGKIVKMPPERRVHVRLKKRADYFRHAMVEHYLIVDPRAASVTHVRRGSDGASPARTITTGAVRLDPPGMELAIAEVFALGPP